MRRSIPDRLCLEPGASVSELPLWRRVTAIVVALVLVTFIVLAVLPTGQVALLPQSPVQLAGRVHIDSRTSTRLQGRLAFVGVEQQPVRLLHKWWLSLREDNATFAAEPTDDSSSGSDDDSTDDPSDSTSTTLAKRVASGIGFELAGKDVKWSGTSATVQAVAPGSPAALAGLHGGDSVMAVDGTDVNNGVNAGELMYQKPVGTDLRLQILRDGNQQTYVVKTVAPPADDTVHESLIGVTLDTIGLEVQLPEPVSINSGGYVGTSGGLAFALYVYDATNTKDDLVEGRSIVATGALTADGLVEPVEHVKLKAIATQRAGADLLLVPKANVDDALAGVRAACTSGVRCVHVVPVTSVKNAIDLLDDHHALQAVERTVEH